MKKKLTKYHMQQFFGADLRSLALFRVGLASLIILDLINRARDLQAHYTDFGLLPRAPLVSQFLNKWHISIHLISGKVEVQAILFIIAGIFALLLLIGYKTRLATIVSWFFLISLHSRNPMVLQGGDVLFRMLLFFAMFIPLGAVYSLDSLNQNNSSRKKFNFLSLSTFALLFQVVVMYLVTFFHKTGSEWFPEGTAIYYTLSIDQFLTPFGAVIYQFPKSFLQILTYLIWFWWLIGPILLIFSLRKMRTIVITIFILINIGIGASLSLGLFPFIIIVSLLAFLPSSFWELRREKLKDKQKGLTLYYDGECGFCKFSTKAIKMFFILPFCDIKPAWKNESIHLKMKRHNSWVLEDKYKNYYYRFDGIILLLGVSPIFFPIRRIASLPPIKKIGNKIYRKISNRRNKVSKCIIPKLTPQKSPSKLLKLFKSLFLIFIIIYISLWNIDNLTQHKLIKNEHTWVGKVLRIDQKWDMFSPRPLTDDGWYIINSTLKDGTNFDLFNNREGEQPIDWEKPKWVAQTYKNQRWRKYMMNIWLKKNKDHRLYYGKYLCRSWNKKYNKNKQLNKFEIIFMREDTLPNYKLPEPKKVVIWRHNCFK